MGDEIGGLRDLLFVQSLRDADHVGSLPPDDVIVEVSDVFDPDDSVPIASLLVDLKELGDVAVLSNGPRLASRGEAEDETRRVVHHLEGTHEPGARCHRIAVNVAELTAPHQGHKRLPVRAKQSQLVVQAVPLELLARLRDAHRLGLQR